MTVGYAEITQVANAAKTIVNPATEEKQDSTITAIGLPLAAGTNLIGSVGIDQTANGITNKVVTEFADNGNLDAFARLRTSSQHIVFDESNEFDTSPLFFEDVLTGGGTVSHLPLEASVRLRVGTTIGDTVVRQSREYFRHIPGKSFLVLMSRVLGIPKANTRQRTGYFDANDGLFFENNGTSFGVVGRTSTSGSVVDNRTAQSSFNIDKLDGTGSSGITLDLSKSNIFIIDFEWLGSGRVRFGFFVNGRPVYCHIISTANTLTTPYMRTGSLPLRQELENTGTSASITDLKISSSSVIIEDGDAEQTGIRTGVSNGVTPIEVTSRRAVLSIRPKATFNGLVNRANIKDIEFEVLIASNNALIEIVYGGTIGGTPSWTSVGSSSAVEYDVAGTTVTGGVIIHSGYAAVGSKVDSTTRNGLSSKLPLALDIAGANPKTLSVVVTAMDGTSSSAACLNWLEIY